VFVGDALSDLRAAEETNMHFVGRRTPENRALFANRNLHLINDLSDLERLLGKITP
jgi:phosphoglycolate phosphatase-like HAD superfamily hydrolase